MSTIEQKLNQLPLDLQQEATDFIDFLLTKKREKNRKKIDLRWMVGELRDLAEDYTSVELQKKSLEWRD